MVRNGIVEKSFVAVYNPDNNQYNYYVQLVDANGNALPLTEEDIFMKI